MRKWRWLAAALLLICPLASCRAETGLTVTFLDVGKADAILIQTANSAVLIDAATEKRGEDVLACLRARGVTRLDALVITHYDKDHVGGADDILEALPVDRALDPAYEKDGKQFRQYVDALAAAGVPRESLSENTSFELDGARYEIDVANAAWYGKDEENDFSLVVRLTYGERTFLFAGDAEAARIDELLEEGDLAADVLKVPHHGQYERNSAAFFAAVGARWGVVTSDEEEPEDQETLKALAAAGTEPLLTREGRVVVTTDGKSLEATQED